MTSFLYEGVPDIPEGVTMQEYRASRSARVRMRTAAVDVCAAIEARDPVWINRAQHDYARALLGLPV
jgi:hypothetical protein